MTSSFGQGSHTVAQLFAGVWGIEDSVTYSHEWREFTDDEAFVLGDSIDAVLVVKDPMSRRLDGVAARLAAEGFRLASPNIGATSLRLDFLKETDMPRGYLDPVADLPAETVKTYSVTTFLVAHGGLPPQMLAAARDLVHPANRFPDVAAPTLGGATEFAQGIEAILGVLVYIGLALLTLFGLDIIAYRKRFNELNTLVSLISMHQSSKDPFGGSEQEKAHQVAYLSVCSDLLGLIGVITGYYAQENSSLMYNRLVGVIHERCSGLKINIQLKILHALIDLPHGSETPPTDPTRIQESATAMAARSASNPTFLSSRPGDESDRPG
jgi:hypothetical protein